MKGKDKTREQLINDLAHAEQRIAELETAESERKRAEQALRESEDRYRQLVEDINNAIYTTDENGVITYVNPAIEALVGNGPSEIIGRSFTEFIHQEDLPSAAERFQKVISGHSEPDEYRILTKSGEIRWIRVFSRPVFRGNRVTGLQGVVTDVTGRKQAEEALRESETRFRVLSDATFEGIAFTEQGIVVDANRQFADLLGYEMNQVQGLDVSQLVAPEDQEFVRSKILAGSEEPYEHRALRKGGAVIFVEVRPRMMSIEGRPMRVTAVRDITERKQVEEERERLLAQIQEQAGQLGQIMDTVPDGVLLLDADWRILSANPPAREYLIVLAGAEVGDTLTHLNGQSLETLLTSPPRGLWHEVAVDRPSRRAFEVIARPMESGPHTEGWVLVLRDVTEKKEIEQRAQQQERLAAVGQLAAGIAHDFNNVMATIVLYAQMTARSEGLSIRDRERMTVINEQAMHASNLIQQILDFSRRSALEQQPVDLLPLLKEQIKLLERTLPEHINIDLAYGPVLSGAEGPDEVDVSLMDATLFTVSADPTRLQQVVMNLAVNARDAMPEGGELHIGLERVWIEDRKRAPLPEMEAGEWVRVTVSDTGTGIPSDVLPHIFEPFFTTKSAGEGTGLGLAQVWGIVNQHEGHVDVTTRVATDCEQSVGTTFTLYLPALESSRPEALAQETSALPHGQGETILVVEDNATVREVLVQSLGLLNYRTLAAADGGEALDAFEQHAEEITLVVSDTVMPVKGGVALLNALREKGRMEPIVMLSGHPFKEDDGLASQGVVARLQKPVSLEQLAQVVAQALRDC